MLEEFANSPPEDKEEPMEIRAQVQLLKAGGVELRSGTQARPHSQVAASPPGWCLQMALHLLLSVVKNSNSAGSWLIMFNLLIK